MDIVLSKIGLFNFYYCFYARDYSCVFSCKGDDKLMNDNKTIVGLYPKVSTEDQSRFGHSLDEQEDKLKQLCNFLLENWAFLLKSFNSLLINCNKVMSNFLTMRFKLI